jgi:hypothetical protein
MLVILYQKLLVISDVQVATNIVEVPSTNVDPGAVAEEGHGLGGRGIVARL